jgi:CDP-glucose 4,6-dehydratase
MEMNPEFWRDKAIFVTGHTGFKGAWLSLWLGHMGAKVHGYATEPPTSPNLFTVANVLPVLASHTIADIRDSEALTAAMLHAAPEIIFHMAAQSLVRLSYRHPVETFAVNVLGTVNVLEAARSCASVRAIVNVTTDKCYENGEWVWAYREIDRLGGRDPYSSSKACSELATAAYRSSYLKSRGVAVATARAGNVIGGGDWAQDRLIPDFFRSVQGRSELMVRNPNATRPWQHVLDSLAGYLRLAECLVNAGGDACDAWNFGPDNRDVRPVQWVIEYLCRRVPEARCKHLDVPQVHEATELRLDSSKARVYLNWSSKWQLATALDRTADWYLRWIAGDKMHDLCIAQINEYCACDGVI